MAQANDGLLALTVSTPAGADWLLTLHSRRPITIEEAEVTKRLAAWASIFAVCTAFAGMWGMNFEHMPELQWQYGYAVALLLIVAACGYLYYRFRRAGWL